jgi:hypothetical protein
MAARVDFAVTLGLRLLMALLLAAAAARLAAASPPPGAAPPATKAPAADNDQSDPAGLRKWYEHGACLVKREGEAAEKILATAPETLQYFTAYLKADGPARCFEGGPKGPWKLHNNAARGAISEALLLRDFSAVGVARGTRAAAVFDAAAPDAAESGTAPGGAARARAFLRLAECVVRLEPVNSFALFSTTVVSAEERAAFRLLVPALGDCLPPGLEIQMRPPVVRSYLSEAAYRVSVEQMRKPKG